VSILVTGAGGLVGQPLLERLAALGFEVVAAGRSARTADWFEWDMNQPPPQRGRGFQSVVHAAPLWLLPRHLPALAAEGTRRVVCYSSTSVLTKRSSASGADRGLAGRLDKAERAVRDESDRLNLATTIFRPTMIYGYGRDENITTIARFILRYGFFPVAGAAAGKRQPIHAADAATAAGAVLEETRTFGKTYHIAGGETLGYRAMVKRIFEALDRPVRIAGLPTRLYKLLLAASGLLGTGLTASMAERMNQDMAFDTSSARDDFGFSPEGFLLHPERDLPTA
jgi:nucleoside-diphosphate-sugar epimerase